MNLCVINFLDPVETTRWPPPRRGEDIVHATWKYVGNMNKARLAEAGRGFYPFKDYNTGFPEANF